MKSPAKFLSLLLGASFSLSAFAFTPLREEGGTTPSLDVVTFTVDQTFQSNFRQGHGYDPNYQFNNCTNTWHYEVDAARRIPLSDAWYLRVGVDVNRYDFGDNRSMAPNNLQSYAMQLGLESYEGGELRFALRTDPGLYFSHKLDGRDFDAPTTVRVFFPMEGGYSLMGGVRLSMQSNYPVLPIVGVLCRLSPRWDLQACLPSPRLIYNYSPALKLWGGGEITGGSFRYDNQGKVDYYEVRTGLGLGYGLNPTSFLQLDGGAALIRNYALRHVTEETRPAPYLKLSLNMAF